ncbi:peptidoglycan/LPS O-acetylase OafA/YrhL [Acidovorax sp. 62]|uniref:acyltransferase family protein n=1 Tax=Acidovorax sp. 62 TaxID=2035203 RepID=UPI000C19DC8D|nr:acyltransferase [Acidovorax sp. 62]PIF90127.1 peptidoglycan/LPS O-acetylase OafA/YrhL [Acidovorax sp. 62]
MSQHTSRLPLLDTVKGLACAAIVAHHLAFYGPMSDIAQPLAPDLMAWLYDYARMAVQVFLVLGGYLAASSLAPEGVARFGQVGQQLSKRFVRLVVPYVVALLVTVLISALVRPWMEHPSVPGDPSLAQLVTHALLLHSLVDHESLSAGVWYVAIDFQLFALSLLMFAAVRALPSPLAKQRAALLGQALVVVGVAASLWGFNRDAQWDVWAVYFFGAYGLGMMAFWASRAPQATGWVLAMAVLGGVGLALEFRARIALALATALLMVWAMRTPAVRQWRGVSPLVRLGQMSYSVFLIHFAVCLLVNAVVSSLWPASPWVNALGMLLAFSLAMVAGQWLYRTVEQRTPTLPTMLRWQASLVAAGVLVQLGSNWG